MPRPPPLQQCRGPILAPETESQRQGENHTGEDDQERPLQDVATDLDAGHLLTLRAARGKDLGRAVTREAAMAKLFASEAAGRAADAAIQVLGANGYMRNFPAERYARDARVTRIYEGTSEVQRLVIARSLLDQAASSLPA